jgi:hypothetical protein
MQLHELSPREAAKQAKTWLPGPDWPVAGQAPGVRRSVGSFILRSHFWQQGLVVSVPKYLFRGQGTTRTTFREPGSRLQSDRPLRVQLGLEQTCPGPHVSDCVLTLISFQIAKAPRQISQDLPIGKILEIAQIGCIKSQLEERIHDAVKQNAGLWTEIVRDFAPLGEPAERASVDLNSRKPGSCLSKVAAIAFAEMAPLIICARLNPISCFPQDFHKR